MRGSHLLGILFAVGACAHGTDEHAADAPIAIDAKVDAPDAAPDACVAVPEKCNGQDEDCDGTIDEDFPELGFSCTAGTGPCVAAGHFVCAPNGSGTVCSAVPGAATAELCDGADNDCDGNVDEDFAVGSACAVGIGACATAGTFACDQVGGVTCLATAGTPTPETCGDAIDQDCNGADAACPINDRPSGALDASGGGTFTTDLSAAHDDDSSTCGGAGGRDVFYQLVLPAAEVIYLDTFGSSFDSTIHLSSGSCTAPTATLACSATACGQHAAQIATQLPAGTYCIAVDQAAPNDTATANGPGSVVLNVVRGGRTGTAIAAASGSVTGDTSLAGKTNQSNPESSCEVNSGQPDDGYFFTSCPGQALTVGATTCGGTVDTIIYLRTGAATHAPSNACDDDGCNMNNAKFQSVFSGAHVTGPNLHWLVVDGFGTGASGKGPYTLSYTIQ